MKHFLIIIVFLIPMFLSAQNNREGRPKLTKEQFEKELARIEQLEKVKLIEILNTDEATVLKFFARRNEFFNKEKKYHNEMKKMSDEFEAGMKSGKKFSNKYYQNLIDKTFSMDKDRVKRREKFYSSLGDLLSKEQIANLVVFAKRYNEQLMHDAIK